MRKFMNEQALKEIAALHSQSICVRTMENGCSRDVWRKATKKQSAAMFSLLYGALRGLNWGEKMRSSADMAQAVIDATEFQAKQRLQPLLPWDEVLQSHMCIYIPLQNIIRDWEQE